MLQKILLFLTILLLLWGLLYFGMKKVFPLSYHEAILQRSQETGVSESLIYAVIHTESGFRSEVDSHLGARGLMQITEDTFEWVEYRQGVDNDYPDLYDPETNIQYGTLLLALLTDEFENDKAVLCAYHAGWGNVKRWLKDKEYSTDGETLSVIPFRDTAHYVHKVQRTQKIYQWLYKLT